MSNSHATLLSCVNSDINRHAGICREISSIRRSTIHGAVAILGICLAVIPCLLETLYLGKCGKSQRISVYVLGLLIPSIVEKVALYLIGAFLCGIDPANIAGVMEAAASREPFVNLFTQPSARYVINILFFNWAYIVCGILFSALCIVFLSKARKVTAA